MLLGHCDVLTTAILPIDVVVNSNIVTVVVVVCFLSFNLIVTGSHHDVARIQKCLTDALLQEEQIRKRSSNLTESVIISNKLDIIKHH